MKKIPIWKLSNLTELTRRFILQCMKLNFNKSINEERQRYSRSPFFHRNWKGKQ